MGIIQSPVNYDNLVEKKIRSAQRVLFLEKFWPRVWLPVCIGGVFFLASILDVWSQLSPRVHLGLLWAFYGAFVLSLLPLVFWRWPSRLEARARLEKVSALPHRPLTAFNDTLHGSEQLPEAAELWRAHQARLSANLDKLSAGQPHPRVDKRDPFALRALLVLTVIVVCVWTWGDIGNRIRAAFKVPDIAPSSDFRLDAFITPPSYTRKEPIMLANGSLPVPIAKEPVVIPHGSALTVRINGGDATRYKVSLGNDSGLKPLDNTAKPQDGFAEFTKKIEASATLSIKQRYAVDRVWNVIVTPDAPPKIAFRGPIELSPRSVMLFKYKVDDDYGVSGAEARIERMPTGSEGSAGSSPQPMIGKPPVFALALPRTPVKSAESKTYKDLTAHPWAGLPVVVSLVAKDEIGQEGLSAPRALILPERKFTKVLAKAIIGQRRALVENPANGSVIAQSLDALAIAGQDDNIPASQYLALKSASGQLKTASSSEQLEDVVTSLWALALRIEDGDLSAAERDLRAAQDALKEGLDRGATPEEIQKLMAELKQALNKFLQALAEKGQTQQDRKAQGGDTKTISPQDLQKLLNKIEQLGKSGAAEAAQQMLSELRDILESLQTAQKGGQGQGDGDSGQAMRGIDRLSDLTRKQQQLLDQTFRAQQQGDEGSGEQNGQRGQRGAQPKSRGSGDAAGVPSDQLRQRQSDLRRQLQDLLSEMPGGDKSAPAKKLQDAERSMGEASDALSESDMGRAGEQETSALDSLRQGTRALAEQMARQQQGQGAEQTSRDPLGRAQEGQFGDSSENVKIPEEIATQRAREILDEVRKRLGEPSRPPAELDYLERLLKQF